MRIKVETKEGDLWVTTSIDDDWGNTAELTLRLDATEATELRDDLDAWLDTLGDPRTPKGGVAYDGG